MKTPDFPDHFFDRADPSSDAAFYRQPRFVQHIDETTIDALTAWYREFLFAGADVLDLMSSWVSHYPAEMALGRVAGLGMNEAELDANPRLGEHCVHDLNQDPELPYGDSEFDRATIAVSIQYLVQPVEVMRSIIRVLRPGGRLCVAMSHRCFPTKAIRAFHQLPPGERVPLGGRLSEPGGFRGGGFRGPLSGTRRSALDRDGANAGVVGALAATAARPVGPSLLLKCCFIQ